MRRACEIVGVNPSTLRQWTAKGRVPVFRTPGGHRRYREEDLRALTDRRAPASARPRVTADPPPDGARTPLATMLLGSHERYESVARRAFQSSAWFRQFDDAARHQFRVLGSSMLQLLSSYVISASRRERERCLDRGRRIAADYGTTAARLGLSLAEATEAFVLFRNPILEMVHRWLQDQPRPNQVTTETLRRVNHFMDQVLLSMATEHERRSTDDAPRAYGP
jgi:excisionase family DNA binding protein